MRPLLTIFALLIVAAFLAVGCTPETEADAGTMDSSTSNQMSDAGESSMMPAGEGVEDGHDGHDHGDHDDSKSATATAPAEPEAKLVAYRNAEGQLACPVMGSPIASEKAAFSYTDYNGKRYYFCCDGCPTVFEKNKDTYAK